MDKVLTSENNKLSLQLTLCKYHSKFPPQCRTVRHQSLSLYDFSHEKLKSNGYFNDNSVLPQIKLDNISDSTSFCFSSALPLLIGDPDLNVGYNFSSLYVFIVKKSKL